MPAVSAQNHFMNSVHVPTARAADSTLKAYDSRLRQLAKHADLDNPDAVKVYIASKDIQGSAFEESVCKSYN